MQLSEQQRAAVEAAESHISVVASAGSGKTRVMVERYIRLVQGGLRPDQILTITFTRKAAAEMRKRIVTRLTELGLVGAAQECETGPIQTIHSFCDRLLKENSVYAGLDPKFRIVEGAEEVIRFERALQTVLDNQIDEHPIWVDYLRRRSGKSHRLSQTTLISYLRLEIQKVLGEVRGTNWSREEFAQTHSDPESVLEHWKKVLSRETGVVLPAETPIETCVNLMSTTLKGNSKRLPCMVGSCSGEGEFLAATDACVLAQLTSEVWRELERSMMRDQVFDFNLTERLAVELLESNPDAASACRDQYRAVLVDESQDVNPTQFRLLEALAADSIVMVGDAQQSIFGFRLADRELFINASERSKKYFLDINHRVEQKGILRFVDLVFGSWWGESYRPMEPVEADLDAPARPLTGVELWPGKKENASLVARHIASLISEGQDPGGIAVTVKSAKYGAKLAEQLALVGVPHLLVGGNSSFYTRMEIHDLANALEALVDPSDSLAVASLLHGPFVGLSTDLVFELALEPVTIDRLRMLEARNSQDHERLETFRQWYFDLVEYADQLPAWELCQALFSRTGYLAAIVGEPGGFRALANVRKLFMQATRVPDVRGLEFAEQIRNIQRLRHNESEADQIDQDTAAVKILTVHKAKGLEFDVVVVPEFLTTRAPSIYDPVVDVRRNLLVGKHAEYDPMVRKLACHYKKDREAKESERVFYVALTRPRHRLCLCVPPELDKSLAGRAASLVGFPKNVEPGIRVRQAEDGTAGQE